MTELVFVDLFPVDACTVSSAQVAQKKPAVLLFNDRTMPPRHRRVRSPQLVGRFSPHRYLIIGECQGHPIERARNTHDPRIHPMLRLELFTISEPSMHEPPRRVTWRPRAISTKSGKPHRPGSECDRLFGR